MVVSLRLWMCFCLILLVLVLCVFIFLGDYDVLFGEDGEEANRSKPCFSIIYWGAIRMTTFCLLHSLKQAESQKGKVTGTCGHDFLEQDISRKEPTFEIFFESFMATDSAGFH